MTHTVYYTGEFVPVEISTRPLDGVTDIWLRRNPQDGHATEVYAVLPTGEAPTREAVEADFDGWFARLDKYTDEAGKTETERRMDELQGLLFAVLGVTE